MKRTHPAVYAGALLFVLWLSAALAAHRLVSEAEQAGYHTFAAGSPAGRGVTCPTSGPDTVTPANLRAEIQVLTGDY